MGRLDVRIVEARNLPNTETIGKPDPYVKIEIENTSHKTSVAESTVNPKWNEVFKFVVADPSSAQMTLKVWNKSLLSKEFTGQYRMSLNGLKKGIVKDVWVLLQQCKTNAEIHLRILAHDFGAEPTQQEIIDAAKTQTPPSAHANLTPNQQPHQYINNSPPQQNHHPGQYQQQHHHQQQQQPQMTPQQQAYYEQQKAYQQQQQAFQNWGQGHGPAYANNNSPHQTHQQPPQHYQQQPQYYQQPQMHYQQSYQQQQQQYPGYPPQLYNPSGYPQQQYQYHHHHHQHHQQQSYPHHNPHASQYPRFN